MNNIRMHVCTTLQSTNQAGVSELSRQGSVMQVGRISVHLHKHLYPVQVWCSEQLMMIYHSLEVKFDSGSSWSGGKDAISWQLIP